MGGDPGKMTGTERNRMRKKFCSRNVPLGFQEHQKGILSKRNGMKWNAGIPQNRGSRIAGTKKGMHNLALEKWEIEPRTCRMQRGHATTSIPL